MYLKITRTQKCAAQLLMPFLIKGQRNQVFDIIMQQSLIKS